MSRVALVHDYLLVMRGAERSFAAIAECFPEAPIYTLLYDPAGTNHRFENREVHTSYLQRFGTRQRGFRRLLPLLPSAVERLPLRDYELVISSSSAFAHGVRVGAHAVHVCYCYTPFRYAWHDRDRSSDEVPRWARPALRRTLARIRRWDLAASRRTTAYIAISELSRKRIFEAWGRDASIVHPPVEVERFRPGRPEGYFLLVTELVKHKLVDVALEAAKIARRPIKVVGGGPELARLSRHYGQSAEFLGRVDDNDLPALFANALAYVMPNAEEFGISAVEAQAAGRPVLAADAGGARETVLPSETGVLVPLGDVDALAGAMAETDFAQFDSDVIRRNAERFSVERFKERFFEEVQAVTRRQRESLVHGPPR